MIVDAAGRLSRRDWCHPRDTSWSEREFVTDYVLEGASACRREAFLAAGGYWPPLFIGHEGWDLAFRLINAGHDLVYTPTVRVHHMVDPSVRPSSRIYYTFTRNAVWVALRNHRRFRRGALHRAGPGADGLRRPARRRARRLPARPGRRGARRRRALATRAPLSSEATRGSPGSGRSSRACCLAPCVTCVNA